jgi:hypothetical protein
MRVEYPGEVPYEAAGRFSRRRLHAFSLKVDEVIYNWIDRVVMPIVRAGYVVAGRLGWSTFGAGYKSLVSPYSVARTMLRQMRNARFEDLARAQEAIERRSAIAVHIIRELKDALGRESYTPNERHFLLYEFIARDRMNFSEDAVRFIRSLYRQGQADIIVGLGFLERVIRETGRIEKMALRKARDDPDFRADLYIYHNATAIMNRVSGTTLSKVTNIPLDVILEEERRMQEAEKHSVEEPSVSAFVRRIEEERRAAGADRDRK